MSKLSITEGGAEITINTETGRMSRLLDAGNRGWLMTFANDRGEVLGARDYNTAGCPKAKLYKTRGGAERAGARWVG